MKHNLLTNLGLPVAFLTALVFCWSSLRSFGNPAHTKAEQSLTDASETAIRAFLEKAPASEDAGRGWCQVLRPQEQDYRAIARQDATFDIFQLMKYWDNQEVSIFHKSEQTKLVIRKATGAMLARGDGGFPPELASPEVYTQLAPNTIFYCFEYVKPGASAGMAYDGLAYVNGHWCLFPKLSQVRP